MSKNSDQVVCLYGCGAINDPASIYCVRCNGLLRPELREAYAYLSSVGRQVSPDADTLDSLDADAVVVAAEEILKENMGFISYLAKRQC